jgi:hypothetical protein
VLVTGQMPDAIHQGLAAVLRYQVRTLGFATMLTSAYPGGLFGDPPAQARYGDPPAQPGYGDPQAQPGYGMQPGYGVQPEYAQAGYGAPAAGPAGGLSWRLVLSAAARKLVILFIVLGVVLAAVNGAVQAALAGNSVSALSAAKQVVADIGPSRNALDNYSANVQACNNQLSCVEGVDRKVAATLNTFAAELRGIAMPSQATMANAALAAAVSGTAAKFAELSTAPSATKYISEAQASGLQQSVDKINQAYDNLGTALSS